MVNGDTGKQIRYILCASSGLKICSSKYQVQVDPRNIVKVSEACQVLNFAGETSLVGYVGTVSEFETQSNGVCAACVDDGLYDGRAQLTVESTFVCEIETTGYISGQSNFNISSFFPGYSRSADVPYLDVVVYAETTPFPKRGFPYDVRVANNDGLEEVL
jgi:hypothetical protein